MSLKVLIDMNISPLWVEYLKTHKVDAVHWSHIGDPKASDHVIMEWARKYKRIVFTNDLDFGKLLAISSLNSPSVIQLRTQNIMPEYLGKTFVAALKQYRMQLKTGCLIVLDDYSDRVRILPIK